MEGFGSLMMRNLCNEWSEPFFREGKGRISNIVRVSPEDSVSKECLSDSWTVWDINVSAHFYDDND